MIRKAWCPHSLDKFRSIPRTYIKVIESPSEIKFRTARTKHSEFYVCADLRLVHVIVRSFFRKTINVCWLRAGRPHYAWELEFVERHSFLYLENHKSDYLNWGQDMWRHRERLLNAVGGWRQIQPFMQITQTIPKQMTDTSISGLGIIVLAKLTIGKWLNQLQCLVKFSYT